MVRQQSPFGHLKGWRLAHFIVKAGDDFRMESLAMQVWLTQSPIVFQKPFCRGSVLGMATGGALTVSGRVASSSIIMQHEMPGAFRNAPYAVLDDTCTNRTAESCRDTVMYLAHRFQFRCLNRLLHFSRHHPHPCRHYTATYLPSVCNVFRQVITLVDDIFKREKLSLRLRPYAIVCCGDMKGMIECITDAKSIDHIKKATAKSGGIRVRKRCSLQLAYAPRSRSSLNTGLAIRTTAVWSSVVHATTQRFRPREAAC